MRINPQNFDVIKTYFYFLLTSMHHHKNIPLCSALIFVKTTSNGTPEIKDIYPKELDLANEKNEFDSIINASKNNSTLSFICFFNTRSYYCTALNFQQSNAFYSIVTLSKYPFYDFFRFMLNAAKQVFDNGYSFKTPYEKYNCIKSCISSFPSQSFHDLIPVQDQENPQPCIKLTIQILNVTFLYNFSHHSFTYDKFHPQEFFTQDEIMSVWHSLFLNEPVLIVTKNQERGSLAVLAAASLFAPLPFKDEFCLWLTRDDDRYDEIVKGRSQILLCATHPDNLSKVKHYFKYIIEIKTNIENNDSSYDLEIFKIMKRTLIIVGDVLTNYSIEKDPYYNLIEGEIDEHLISNALKKYPPEYVLPSVAEIRDFAQTQSFKEWRRNLNPGEDYRDIFLNLDPETLFKNRSIGDLRRIEKYLGLMIENYSRDAHVDAVLKHHRKVVHQMISCN